MDRARPVRTRTSWYLAASARGLQAGVAHRIGHIAKRGRGVQIVEQGALGVFHVPRR
jgi:hypothetical protein